MTAGTGHPRRSIDRIEQRHYMTHAQLNPARIVPRVPLVEWTAPHGRERLP